MNVNLSKRRGEQPAEPVMLVEDPPAKPGGKNAPTLRRTQARAARKQELKGRPLSGRERRRKMNSVAAETRAAMKSTDPAKLPASERVPELVYARDLVDSRANLGTAIIPVAVVYFIASFAVSKSSALSLGVLLLSLFWFLAMLADSVVMSRKLEAKVLARHPDSTVKVRMYAARRAFALKRLRRPVPREVPAANRWRA